MVFQSRNGFAAIRLTHLPEAHLVVLRWGISKPFVSVDRAIARPCTFLCILYTKDVMEEPDERAWNIITPQWGRSILREHFQDLRGQPLPSTPDGINTAW